MKRTIIITLAGVALLGAACSDPSDIELVDQSAETTAVEKGDPVDAEQVEDETSTTTTAKPKPTTTVPPTTTTAPPPESGTWENPDKLGATYEVTSDGMNGEETWHFKVDSVNFDGWPAIQAENQFNTAPPPGWRFVMVQVSVAYVDGPGPSSPGWVADVTATGSANQIYEEYSDLPNGESGCGVIPGELTNHDDLMPGGGATGNLCVPVPDAEIADGSLRLLVAPTMSWDDSDMKWVTPFA